MENQKTSKVQTLIGIALCLAAAALYGIMPSMTFLCYDVGLESATILFEEFFIAAILMWAYIFIKKIPFKLDKKTAAPVLIVGISYMLMMTLLYKSYDYISGSLAAIISYIFPSLVVLFDIVTKKQRARFATIGAVIVSMIGLIIVTGSPDGEVKILGVIFALLCAVAYAAYIIFLDHKDLKDFDSTAVVAYLFLISAIVNGVRCVFAGQPLMVFEPLPMLYVFILSFFCCFLAIFFFASGVKRIGSTKGALLEPMEPVCACIFGFLLVGDDITINMIIGCLLVVIAVIMSCIPDKKALPQGEDVALKE